MRKYNSKTLGTQERDIKNNMRKKLGAFVILILTVYLGLQGWFFTYSQQNDITKDKTYFVAKIITSKLDALFQPPNSIPGKDCSIPDDWLYPLCKYKVEVR